MPECVGGTCWGGVCGLSRGLFPGRCCRTEQPGSCWQLRGLWARRQRVDFLSHLGEGWLLVSDSRRNPRASANRLSVGQLKKRLFKERGRSNEGEKCMW